MTPDAVGSYVSLFMKLLILLGFGIYLVYAAVMVRQEQLMAKVLIASSEPMLKILTLLHLLASVFIFFLALLIL